jgi:hypothetical protein
LTAWLPPTARLRWPRQFTHAASAPARTRRLPQTGAAWIDRTCSTCETWLDCGTCPRLATTSPSSNARPPVSGYRSGAPLLRHRRDGLAHRRLFPPGAPGAGVFAAGLLWCHLLAVANTRRGKSSLLLRMVRYLMHSHGEDRCVVLVDPHRGLAVSALGLVPVSGRPMSSTWASPIGAGPPASTIGTPGITALRWRPSAQWTKVRRVRLPQRPDPLHGPGAR